MEEGLISSPASDVSIERWKEFNLELADQILELKKQLAQASKRRSDAARVPGDPSYLQEKVVELKVRLKNCRIERDALKDRVTQLTTEVEKLKGGDAAVLDREAKALERVKLVESELQCANKEAASKGKELETVMNEVTSYKNLYESARAEADESTEALRNMNAKCAGLQVRLGDAEIAMDKLKAEKLDVDTKLRFSATHFAGLKESLKAMSAKDDPVDREVGENFDPGSPMLALVTPRGGPFSDTPRSSVGPVTPEPVSPVRPTVHLPRSSEDVKGEVNGIMKDLDVLSKELKASERVKREAAEKLRDTEDTLRGLEMTQNSDVGIYEKEMIYGSQPDLSPRNESWDVRRDGIPGEALAEVRMDVKGVRTDIEGSFGDLRGITGIREKLTPVVEHIKKDQDELGRAQQAAWDMGAQLATAIQDGDKARAIAKKLERELDGAKGVHRKEIKALQERIRGMEENLARQVGEKNVAVNRLEEVEKSAGEMQKELAEKRGECEELGNHVITASRSLRGDVLVIHQDLEDRRKERDMAVKRRVHSEEKLRDVEGEKVKLERERKSVQEEVGRLKEENDRAFHAVDELEKKLEGMTRQVGVLEQGREEHAKDMEEANNEIERVHEENESLAVKLLAMEKEVEVVNEQFDAAVEEKVDVEFQLKALWQEYSYLNDSAESLARKVLEAEADSKDLAASNDELIDQLDNEKLMLDRVKAAIGRPLRNSGRSSGVSSQKEGSTTSLGPLFEGEVLEMGEPVAETDVVSSVEAMVKENRDLKGMVYSLGQDKGRLEKLQKPDPIIIYKEMGGSGGGATGMGPVDERGLEMEAGFLKGELMNAEKSNKLLKEQLSEATDRVEELEDAMADMNSEIEAAQEGLKSVAKQSLLRELTDLKEANRKKHSENRELASQLNLATKKIQEFDKMFQAGSPGSGFLASKNVALQGEIGRLRDAKEKLKSDLEASEGKSAELGSENKMLLTAIDGLARKCDEAEKFAPQHIRKRELSPGIMEMIAKARKESEENENQGENAFPPGGGGSQGGAGGSGSGQGGDSGYNPSGSGNGNGNGITGNGGDDGGDDPGKWVGTAPEPEIAGDLDEEGEEEEEPRDHNELMERMGSLWQGSSLQSRGELSKARSRLGACKHYPYSKAAPTKDEYVEVVMVVKEREGGEVTVDRVVASTGTQTEGGRMSGDDMSRAMSRKWHGVSERSSEEQEVRKMKGEFERLRSKNIENIGKLRVLEYDNQKMKAELEAALVGNQYLEGELRGKKESNQLLMVQLDSVKNEMKKLGEERGDDAGGEVRTRDLPGFGRRGSLGAMQEGKIFPAELEEARAEIAVLKSRIADFERPTNEAQGSARSDVKRLQGELEQTKGDRADLKQKLGRLDSELRKATEQARLVQGEKEALQKERDLQKKEKEEFGLGYDRTLEVLKDTEAERTRLEGEVSKLKEERDKLKLHRERVNKQKTEAERQLNEAKQYEIRCNFLDKERKVANEEGEKRDLEIQRLRKELGNVKEEAGRLRNDAREWNQERESMRGNLYAAQQEQKVASDRVADIKGELEKVKQERDRVKDDYDMLKQMKEEMAGGGKGGTREISLENINRMRGEKGADEKKDTDGNFMETKKGAKEGGIFPQQTPFGSVTKDPSPTIFGFQSKPTNDQESTEAGVNPFSGKPLPVQESGGNENQSSSPPSRGWFDPPSEGLFSRGASSPPPSAGLFGRNASSPPPSVDIFGQGASLPPSPSGGGFGQDASSPTPSADFFGQGASQLAGGLMFGSCGGGGTPFGRSFSGTGSPGGTQLKSEAFKPESSPPPAVHSSERSPSPSISETVMRLHTPERDTEDRVSSPTPPRVSSMENLDEEIEKPEQRTREVTPEPEVSARGNINPVVPEAGAAACQTDVPTSAEQISTNEKTEGGLKDGDEELPEKLEMGWSTGRVAAESPNKEEMAIPKGEMVSKEEAEKLKKALQSAESRGVQNLGRMVMLQNENSKLAAKLKAAESRLKALEEAESSQIRSIAMVKLLENDKVKMGAEIESLKMELDCVVGEFENKKVGNRMLCGELEDYKRQVEDLKAQVKARERRIAELEEALRELRHSFAAAKEELERVKGKGLMGGEDGVSVNVATRSLPLGLVSTPSKEVDICDEPTEPGVKSQSGGGEIKVASRGIPSGVLAGMHQDDDLKGPESTPCDDGKGVPDLEGEAVDAAIPLDARTRSLPAYLMPNIQESQPHTLASASTNQLSPLPHAARDPVSKMYLQWSNAYVAPGTGGGVPDDLEGELYESDNTEEGEAAAHSSVETVSDEQKAPCHFEPAVANKEGWGEGRYPDVNLQEQVFDSTFGVQKSPKDTETRPYYLGGGPGIEPPPGAAKIHTRGIKTPDDVMDKDEGESAEVPHREEAEDSTGNGEPQLPVSHSSHSIDLEESGHHHVDALPDNAGPVTRHSAGAKSSAQARSALDVGVGEADSGQEGQFEHGLAEHMERSWLVRSLALERRDLVEVKDKHVADNTVEGGVAQEAAPVSGDTKSQEKLEVEDCFSQGKSPSETPRNVRDGSPGRTSRSEKSSASPRMVKTREVAPSLPVPLHMGLDPPIGNPLEEGIANSLPSGRQSARSSGKSHTRSVSSEVELLPLRTSLKESQSLGDVPNKHCRVESDEKSVPERVFSPSTQQWNPSSFFYPMWHFWSSLSSVQKDGQPHVQDLQSRGSEENKPLQTPPGDPSNVHPEKVQSEGAEQGIPPAKNEDKSPQLDCISDGMGPGEIESPGLAIQTRGLKLPFTREVDAGPNSNTVQKPDEVSGGERGEAQGDRAVELDVNLVDDMDRFWFGGSAPHDAHPQHKEVSAPTTDSPDSPKGLEEKDIIRCKEEMSLEAQQEDIAVDSIPQAEGSGEAIGETDREAPHSSQENDKARLELPAVDVEIQKEDLAEGDVARREPEEKEIGNAGGSEVEIDRNAICDMEEQEVKDEGGEEAAFAVGSDNRVVELEEDLVDINDVGEDLMPNSIVIETDLPHAEPIVVVPISTESDFDSVDFESFRCEAQSVVERILSEREGGPHQATAGGSYVDVGGGSESTLSEGVKDEGIVPGSEDELLNSGREEGTRESLEISDAEKTTSRSVPPGSFALGSTQGMPGGADVLIEPGICLEKGDIGSSQENVPDSGAELSRAGFGSISFTGSMKDRIMEESLDEEEDVGASERMAWNLFSEGDVSTKMESALPPVWEDQDVDSQECKSEKMGDQGSSREDFKVQDPSEALSDSGPTPQGLSKSKEQPKFVFTFGAPPPDESIGDLAQSSTFLTVDEEPEKNPFLAVRDDAIDSEDDGYNVPRFGLGYKPGVTSVQPTGNDAFGPSLDDPGIDEEAVVVQSDGDIEEANSEDGNSVETRPLVSMIRTRGVGPELLQALEDDVSEDADEMDVEEEEKREEEVGCSTKPENEGGVSEEGPRGTSTRVGPSSQFILPHQETPGGLGPEIEEMDAGSIYVMPRFVPCVSNRRPPDRDSSCVQMTENKSMDVPIPSSDDTFQEALKRSPPVPPQRVPGDGTLEKGSPECEPERESSTNQASSSQVENEAKQHVPNVNIQDNDEDKGEQDGVGAPSIRSRGLPLGLLFGRDAKPSRKADEVSDDLRPVLQEANDRNSALQEEIQTARQELESSQKLMSDVLGEREALKRRIQEGQMELDNKTRELQHVVEQRGRKAEELEDALNEGKAALVALDEAQQDRQRLERNLSSVLKQNEDLRARISEKDRAIDDVEQQRGSVAKELQNSKEKEAELEREIQALTLDREKRDVELTRREVAVQTANDRYQELAEELENAKRQESNLMQQMEELAGEVEGLKEALSDQVQNAVEERGMFAKELNESKQREQDLLQRANTLEAAQGQSRAELDRRNSAVQAAEEETKKLCEELVGARELELKLVNEVEISTREANQLRSGLDGKEKEAQEMAEAHQEVLKDLEGARVKERALETQVALLVQETDSLKVRLSQGGKESQELEAQRGKLAKELADVREHEEQLAKDSNDARVLLASREQTLSGEIDGLQTKYNSALAELEEANKRNTHLQGLIAEGERVRQEMGDRLEIQQLDLAAAAEAAGTMAQDLDETRKQVEELTAATRDLDEEEDLMAGVHVRSRGLPSSCGLTPEQQDGCPQCPVYLAQLEDITVERNELKALVAVLSSEKETLKSTASELRQQLAESQRDRQEDIEALNKSKRNEGALQKLHAEAQSEKDKIAEDLEALRTDFATREEELLTAMESLGVKSQTAVDGLKVKEEECQKLLESMERGAEERAKLEMVVADLSSEKDDLRTRLISAQSRMQKTSEDFSDSLKLERSEKNAATTTLAALRSDCDMFAGQVAKLKREKHEVEQGSITLQERYDNLLSRNLDLEKQVQDAMASGSSKSELAEALSEQEKMRATLQERDQEVQRLRLEIENLNVVSMNLKDEVESIRIRNTDLQQEMERLLKGTEATSASQITTREIDDVRVQHAPKDDDTTSDAQGSVRSRTVDFDLLNPFYETSGGPARSDSSVAQSAAQLEKDELVSRVIAAEKAAASAKTTLNRSRNMHVKKLKEEMSAAEKSKEEIARLKKALASLEAEKREADAKLSKLKNHSRSMQEQLEAIQLVKSIQTEGHPEIEEMVEKTTVEMQKLMAVNRDLIEEHDRVGVELAEAREALEAERDERREAMVALEEKMKAAETEVESLSTSLNDVVQTTMSLGSELETARSEKDAQTRRLMEVLEDKRSILQELQQFKNAVAEIRTQGRSGPSSSGKSREVQTVAGGACSSVSRYGNLKESIDEMALEVEKLGVVFHSLKPRRSVKLMLPGLKGLETVMEESSGGTEESPGNSGQSEESFHDMDVDVDVPPGEFGLGEAKGKKGRKKKSSQKKGSEKKGGSLSLLPRPPPLQKKDKKDVVDSDQRQKPGDGGGPSEIAWNEWECRSLDLALLSLDSVGVRSSRRGLLRHPGLTSVGWPEEPSVWGPLGESDDYNGVEVIRRLLALSMGGTVGIAVTVLAKLIATGWKRGWN